MQQPTLGMTCVRLFATAAAARQHSGAAHVWCTTFAQLLAAFAGPQHNHQQQTLRTIDLATTRLLMAHLKPLRPSDGSPGATHFQQIRALSRALMQLRTAGITAAHLGQLAQPSPHAAALCLDLMGYERALADRGWSDTADEQRHSILRAAMGQWPGVLMGMTEVIVEPGIELFDLRRDLLRVLAARGVSVCIKLPYSPVHPLSTPWAEAMLHGFEAQDDGRMQIEDGLFEQDQSEAHLGMSLLRLLQLDLKTHDVSAIDSQRCAVVTVPAGDALVQDVLGTIMTWLEEGAVPSGMAIVLPQQGALGPHLDPSKLGPELAREFKSQGVPCQLSTGPSLIEHAHGQMLLALMRLGQEVNGLPPPPTGAIMGEEGISVGLWASCLNACGTGVNVEQDVLTREAQANLMRRCGHRRLGPQGLRRALASLRGVPKTTAEATADAALQLVRQWVLPLLGPPAPLTTALQPCLAYLAHVATAPDGTVPPMDDHPVYAALQSLQQSAASFTGVMGLGEVLGWVLGTLSEQRSVPAEQDRHPGGVAILSGKDIVGRTFSHVLALGLNNTPPEPTTGPLSEAVRREINRGIGYKLLQYGAVTGRAPLPADAKRQFYFYEMLRACSHAFRAVVVQSTDDELSAPMSDLALLMQRAQLQLKTAASHWQTPWCDAPTQALRLRLLVAQNALPWATQQKPFGALFAPLQAQAALMAVARPKLRKPLNSAHRQQINALTLSQVVGVSSLDTLAMCHFRYFASALLGLSKEPHPEHQIDRRRAGEAAHRALYKVYTALLQEAPWPAWCQRSDATLARARVLFDMFEADIMPVTWVHHDLRAGALQATWHAVERQLQRDLAAPHKRPVALEYRFGDPVRSGKPPLVINHPLGQQAPLLVRGTIDRIDWAEGSLDVVDYKSTLPSRETDRHVQLGLYQAVAVRDFADEPHAAKELLTTATWQLLGKPTAGPPYRSPPELKGRSPEVVQRTFEAVWARVDSLMGGQISPDPAPVHLCKHCDFIKLCRFQNVAEGQQLELADPIENEPS